MTSQSTLPSPQRVTLARDARGLTQKALARLTGVSQSRLSKVEAGDATVDGEFLVRLVAELDFPAEFFCQPPGKDQSHQRACDAFYRKRASVKVSDLKIIRARADIHLEWVERLTADQAASEFAIPDWHERLANGETPESLARALRKHWKLGTGPINNLTALIERAGGVVIPSRFPTPKLDALSRRTSAGLPVFQVNSDKPTDRIRFTMAHELGHMVMHQHTSESMESEADQFAAEFLMPEASVRPALEESRLTPLRLAALKPMWQASIQALAYRAKTLKAVSQSEHKWICIQIGRLGWRKEEPAVLAPESCTSMLKLFEGVDPSLNRTTLARHLTASESDIAEVLSMVS